MKRSAAGYYIRSIVILLAQVREPFRVLGLALGNPRNRALSISLRNGNQFLVHSLLDVWVVKETVLDRQYETASVPLQAGWSVIDIGAAFGDYAVWAAVQLRQGRLIAVEPHPGSVDQLRQNLVLNGVNNVLVIQAAVAGASGETALHIIGSSSVMHSTVSSTGSDGMTPVPSIDLEALFNEAGLAHCDYLKMDCEGAEYEILFKAPREVFSRIDRICLEVHDGLTDQSRADMVMYLQGIGYQTRLTENPVHDFIALLYAWREEKEQPHR